MLLPQLPALQEMGSSWMDYTHTREVWNSIHTYKQTHMCTHSQTDRQTHTPLTILALQLLHIVTDRQTDKHTHRQTDRQTDTPTSHNPGTAAAAHCHRQTDRQTHVHTLTDRQTDKHTHLSQSWHCSCSTLSQTHVHILTDRQTHTHTSHNPGTVAAPHCP